MNQFADEREHVGNAGRLRRHCTAQRALLQATAAGNQTDTNFDQPDITLDMDDAFRAMQRELTPTAERHAAHRCDGRHLRILKRISASCNFFSSAPIAFAPPDMKSGRHRLQIGAHRKRLIGRPHHQTAIAAFRKGRSPSAGPRPRLVRCVNLGLDREQQNLGALSRTECPDTARLVLEQCLAAAVVCRCVRPPVLRQPPAHERSASHTKPTRRAVQTFCARDSTILRRCAHHLPLALVHR